METKSPPEEREVLRGDAKCRQEGQRRESGRERERGKEGGEEGREGGRKGGGRRGGGRSKALKVVKLRGVYRLRETKVDWEFRLL